MRRRLAALLALVAVSCGCDGDRATESDAGRAQPREAPSVRPAAERVVSTVNGDPITLDEVEEIARATGLSPLEALRRLQEERVLVAHATAAGLDDDAEVEDAVRRAAVQALLEERVEREVTESSISASAIAERVEAQRARWTRPERRRTTHVLARVEPDAPPEAEAAARRFAQRAVERLLAADDRVAAAHELAAEDDPRRTFRVVVEDLPAFGRDARLVPEFLEAAFGPSEAGVVPGPVRTRFGWHAIVVTEIVPPWEAPREEMEDAARRELLVEARAARLDELVRELESRTPVVRDEAAIGRTLEADLSEGGGAGP